MFQVLVEAVRGGAAASGRDPAEEGFQRVRNEDGGPVGRREVRKLLGLPRVAQQPGNLAQEGL